MNKELQEFALTTDEMTIIHDPEVNGDIKIF